MEAVVNDAGEISSFDACWMNIGFIVRFPVTSGILADIKQAKRVTLQSNVQHSRVVIDDNWVVQSSGFELLTGEKVDDGDNVYIGVNKQVEQASSVKLTFNIRNSIYEYVLR